MKYITTLLAAFMFFPGCDRVQTSSPAEIVEIPAVANLENGNNAIETGAPALNRNERSEDNYSLAYQTEKRAIIKHRKNPRVSLFLSSVSAQRHPSDTLFRCNVKIVNDTGDKLTVTTSCFSVFDGLDLVVTDIDGKILKQQPYLWHQSPFTIPGRELPLEPGTTEANLFFPLSDFGTVGQLLKIRLVGTLPGSTYKNILSTETLNVVVSEHE